MSEPPCPPAPSPEIPPDNWRIRVQDPTDRRMLSLPAFSHAGNDASSTTDNKASSELSGSPGFPERGQGYLALGQINMTPGDLRGNAEKIMSLLTLAEADGLDLIIFPELSLMGYPPRDIITRHPFLVKENVQWLRAIAERTGRTHALIGFVEPRVPTGDEQRIGKDVFNAVALLGEGRIQAIIRKQLLPEYSELEDARQFEPWSPDVLACGLPDAPSPADGVITVHGRRYGVSICEDMWNDPDFFDRPLYGHDPVARLAAAKPEALINLSSSPTRSRKEQVKHRLCAHLASKHRLPYIYVNSVGSVDEVSFDGASRVYDAEGQLVARARSFEEQCLIVNPFRREGAIYPLPRGLEDVLREEKPFQADDESDLDRTYQSLVQGIRDYFRKTGFKKAVLGLSGGLDSSVTVVLLADALGPQNVLGLSMPSRLTPEENRSDAKRLADRLGVPLVEAPIATIVDAFGETVEQLHPSLESLWGTMDSRSNARENVQAIARATLLRQVGNAFRALPVATSDKSELYLGYATVNGDMSGALAPLGDLAKTKVRALARWMNAHRPGGGVPVLPDAVITKPSGADLKRDPLTGRLVAAEEELMPYAFADEIIWRLESLHQSMAEMREARFEYETRHPLDPAVKEEWLRRFFARMSGAVFKWFIAPPILIVEGGGSIAKSDYHHPIVANRIAWAGHSDAEIGRALDDCDTASSVARSVESAPEERPAGSDNASCQAITPDQRKAATR